MWVRSQDKERLANVTRVEIGWREHKGRNDRIYIIWGSGAIELAVFSSKEKALKVIDMFENHIKKSNNYYNQYNGETNTIVTQEIKVFQFPQDDEVEVDE